MKIEYSNKVCQWVIIDNTGEPVQYFYSIDDAINELKEICKERKEKHGNDTINN